MYGLLGYQISYSFSPQTHKQLGYDYGIFDCDEEAFHKFMKEKTFKGINVTIPYKKKVIEYLDYIDPLAEKVEAVNTIVNKNGKLYGYNTDILGFDYSLSYHKVPVENNKVLILGTGNTSKSVREAVLMHNPKEVNIIGRKTEINYDNLEDVLDSDVIINTTPFGVKPDLDESLLDLSEFTNLKAAIDVLYNPLRTKIVSDALEMGHIGYGGLLMLTSQAVFASERFFDHKIPEEKGLEIYHKLLNQMENIVLIGMPSAGKSTVAKLLAKKLNREVYDSDMMIVEREMKQIKEIFEEDGEDYFRMKEASILKDVAIQTEAVIATGGGSILDKDVMKRLKQNSKIIFLDRPLELLEASDDRPLSQKKESLQKLYKERIDLYKHYADYTIKNDSTLDDVVNAILDIVK